MKSGSLLYTSKWLQLLCYYVHWVSIDDQKSFKLRTLTLKIQKNTLIVVVEHVLNTVSIVHYSVHCMNDTNPIESLFKAQLSQLFAVTTFSPWKAFIGKYINIVATFFWSYTDLFVMMISLGLSSGFKHINAELRRINGKVHMQRLGLRCAYGCFNLFIDIFEDIFFVNVLVLAYEWRILVGTTQSISKNGRSLQRYWSGHISCHASVIVQQSLFHLRATDEKLEVRNSIKQKSYKILRFPEWLKISPSFCLCRPMPSLVHAVYFWFSLIFLITRTLAVSLYSAEIHEESKKPIEILRSVPHGSWYIQVQRFAEEVVHGMVALTGMQFFYLTRPLILNVKLYTFRSHCQLTFIFMEQIAMIFSGCRHNCDIWIGFISILCRRWGEDKSLRQTVMISSLYGR